MIILDELSEQKRKAHWQNVERLQAQGYAIVKEHQPSSGPVYFLELRLPGETTPRQANIVWRESRR